MRRWFLTRISSAGSSLTVFGWLDHEPDIFPALITMPRSASRLQLAALPDAAVGGREPGPFFRSHPSLPLTLAALGVAAVGTLLPAAPLAATLGFQPLPGAFFAALAGMVVAYLALIEAGKRIFCQAAATAPAAAARPRRYGRHHLLRRRAARFSTAARSPATSASGPHQAGPA